jgi:hypothetical protein
VKPDTSRCEISCPNCAKTHLRASGSQKNFLGSLALAIKGRGRRRGEERGGEGKGRGGEGRGRGRERRGKEEGREGRGGEGRGEEGEGKGREG